MWELQGSACTLLLTVNNFLQTGAGILVVLGFLYAFYQLRQKNKERLAAQTEEAAGVNTRLLQLQAQYFRLLAEKEWLMKEVHHRVAPVRLRIAWGQEHREDPFRSQRRTRVPNRARLGGCAGGAECHESESCAEQSSHLSSGSTLH